MCTAQFRLRAVRRAERQFPSSIPSISSASWPTQTFFYKALVRCFVYLKTWSATVLAWSDRPTCCSAAGTDGAVQWLSAIDDADCSVTSFVCFIRCMLRVAGGPCAHFIDAQAYGEEQCTKNIGCAVLEWAPSGCDRTQFRSSCSFYSDIDRLTTVHVLENNWFPGIMHGPICQECLLPVNSAPHDTSNRVCLEGAVYL